MGITPSFWEGKKVLVTGHTGFKGSWLSLWLQQLGASVCGYSVGVPTDPALYDLACVADGMNSMLGDVRDLATLSAFVDRENPDIVIHMAAQALVRPSYRNPVDTYSTNVMGTVNLLEAVRVAGSVRVVLIVTSDKCYENEERDRGYREDEPMGGFDPYSSSKGCAELVTAAYRSSFFGIDDFERHGTAVASVRAGNVIGGGDWADGRLIPDIIGPLSAGLNPELRNPGAIRPWQFVLDPLHGYLILAENLWNSGPEYAGAWNFGPDDADTASVSAVAERLVESWHGDMTWKPVESDELHEAAVLKIDSSKARSVLSWAPALDLETAITWVGDWYRQHLKGAARRVTHAQLDEFQARVCP